MPPASSWSMRRPWRSDMLADNVSSMTLSRSSASERTAAVSGQHPSVRKRTRCIFTCSPGRSGSKWEKITSAGIGEPEPRTDGTYEGGHVAAITDLIEAVEKDRETRCSARDGTAIVEMIAAVFESHRVSRAAGGTAPEVAGQPAEPTHLKGPS